MKIAIMQPYFFPYIGYFHLINAVDVFVVYDNIKYTKKGWINRNRMLQNGKGVIFSLPLKSDSDYLEVRNRQLAAHFNRDKLLNRIREAYLAAPYFNQTFPLIENVVRFEEANLFRFLYYSIVKTCEHLGIATKIKVSSEFTIDHNLKHLDRVLALCDAIGANTYVNAIGGMQLYSSGPFLEKGIELQFIKSGPFEYRQFGNEFEPWLSIIDVLFFNSLDTFRARILKNYELI